METYTDFLAGLAAGERACLGKNKKPDILIVREKQLTEAEYAAFFTSFWEKSRNMGCSRTVIIPHTYLAAAKQTESDRIHLPFRLFQEYQERGALRGLQVGVSIHAVEEARMAQELGAAYVTAGHIFTTDCKKGVRARGMNFLEQVCAAVDIPVYAIGGIHEQQMPLISKSQAAGACMMSEYMLAAVR